MKKILLTLSLTYLLLLSCNTDQTVKRDFLKENIDSTINPSDDFFSYANGGWFKKNSIPDDQSAWGIGNVIHEDIYERLKKINEESLQATEGVEKLVGNFWYSAMDTTAIENMGLSPVEPELKSIAAITDIPGLLKVVAELHQKDLPGLFNEGIMQDSKNSEQMAIYLFQGGLGLPNRNYYFNTDERTVHIRKEYVVYMTELFGLLGMSKTEAAKAAKDNMALETRFAAACRKLEDLRDPNTNYHKFAVKDLSSLTPSINWPVFFTGLGITNLTDSIIVGQPEFYQQLQVLLEKTPIAQWKNYLSFHVVRAMSPYLSSTFINSRFNFYGKTINGVKKMKPRWKTVLDVQDGIMGEALGRVFVKTFFNEKAKKRYSNMVDDVKASLKEHIEKLDWMSDSTKEKALTKLAAMKKKVGYPDKWRDYSSMQIDRGSYARNIISASIWWTKYSINKLHKPVDREEWGMNPQTYNAYYSPTNNEIVLPAGIFTVPGFRDEELDDALVWGYAGATTIGHEITHGFDDNGRKYDAKGNLTNWWTAADEQKFTERAKKMINQYNNIVVVDTLRINGSATLGENIADLGAAVIALDAFKKTSTYKKGKLINGMTPLQRFFHGYALGWLFHARKEYQANLVMVDVHSPAKYRVNATFANVPEFYEAWPVKPVNGMYLADSLRTKIW